jgi:hypothetical protein
VRTARIFGCRLRRFSLSVFIKLAPVEAVVNDDAFIVMRFAPAIVKRMLAQIVHGNNLNNLTTDNLPRLLMVGADAHRLFLVCGLWNDVSIDLHIAPHKARGGGLLGPQEKKCDAGLLGFIYRCERGKVL